MEGRNGVRERDRVNNSIWRYTFKSDFLDHICMFVCEGQHIKRSGKIHKLKSQYTVILVLVLVLPSSLRRALGKSQTSQAPCVLLEL